MNIIFDWSGTLADDQTFTWQMTNKVLTHFGQTEVTQDIYLDEFVIPLAGFYEKRCAGISMDVIDPLFFQYYSDNADQVHLFHGMKDLLSELAKHHSLFILSTLDSDAIKSCLKQFQILDLFQQVWGSTPDKTQALGNHIEALGLIKADTVFIGDTPHDINAARTAKVKSIAVNYGYSPVQKLAAALPDNSVTSVQHLADHLTFEHHRDHWKMPLATVGGLVFNQRGEALFIQTEKWSDLYGTPGGKMEYGETMEDAFIREIREETGLVASNVQFVIAQDCVEHPQFYKPKHFILLNYIAECETDDVTLNYESHNYQWCKLEDSLQLPLNEPTITLVNQVLRSDLHYAGKNLTS
jgi:phosphoglycolate phosphatase-like HAD superfamily hydrolase/ADP-ribose pyrophosphatase YjhB (NUDIX family)